MPKPGELGSKTKDDGNKEEQTGMIAGLVRCDEQAKWLATLCDMALQNRRWGLEEKLRAGGRKSRERYFKVEWKWRIEGQ